MWCGVGGLVGGGWALQSSVHLLFLPLPHWRTCSAYGRAELEPRGYECALVCVFVCVGVCGITDVRTHVCGINGVRLSCACVWLLNWLVLEDLHAASGSACRQCILLHH